MELENVDHLSIGNQFSFVVFDMFFWWFVASEQFDFPADFVYNDWTVTCQTVSGNSCIKEFP